MLGSALPIIFLVSAFIVVCCDPELRDAKPVASNKQERKGHGSDDLLCILIFTSLGCVWL